MRAGHGLLQLSLAMIASLAIAQSAPPAASPDHRYAQALTAQPGDPSRGRRLVVDRQQGFCLLCHSGPFPEERFQGTLGPDLSIRAGQRVAQDVRAQLLAPALFNPETIMPAYGQPAVPGVRVHPQFQGKSLLQPQDIEDIVAFLTLMQP
jgi:sulfur-oxidizing protein SoxX